MTREILATLPRIYLGAQSIIYLWMDSAEGSGHPVIVKIPRQDPAPTRARARLAHEYVITRDLMLPGIRRTYGFLEIEGIPAVLLEYLEADTLCEAFVRQRRCLEEMLLVSISISSAVHQLHRAGLLHRNLCCPNILVDRQSLTATLIDFSLAVRSDATSDEMRETLEGPLAYLSPEQIRPTGQPVDVRSDLYMLGVTLYEVWTGRLPFVSDDPLELIHSHLARCPVLPSKVYPVVKTAFGLI